MSLAHIFPKTAFVGDCYAKYSYLCHEVTADNLLKMIIWLCVSVT